MPRHEPDPAVARRAWPIHVYRLGQEPGDDLSAVTTAEQRLEMVAILSARMWTLTGRPRPSYRRAEMPIRVIRPA
ncbi:MAG TPA: hypothetical protein VFW66_01360 [Gemmatimonadales bacterium]|nr:hypothetical protein [Gemmatimonadales bacterium]